MSSKPGIGPRIPPFTFEPPRVIHRLNQMPFDLLILTGLVLLASGCDALSDSSSADPEPALCEPAHLLRGGARWLRPASR